MLKHNDQVKLNSLASRLEGLLSQMVAEQTAPIQSQADERVALAANKTAEYWRKNNALAERIEVALAAFPDLDKLRTILAPAEATAV